MNRRQFIQLNAIGIASIGVGYAAGNNHNEHSMHEMHNMHEMMNSHANMIDTSFITLENEGIKLIDENQIPIKNNLQSLPLLKNTSNTQNKFIATIEVKESQIEIANGKKTKFYTYNGLIPGPKIEVYEGDEIEINVINKLDEPTTIHWHGLPIPPEQDGNPHDPIMPHSTRSYKFKLPQNCAGTYWYHPHPHYISSKQVYMGLAGAFVVKSKKDSLSHLQEQDWFISDLRLNTEAQIPDNSLSDWLNGREGNIILINGQLKPQIQINKRQRIRIYNACSARYLRLKIKDVAFMLVGTDGGLLENPVSKDELLVTPASRVEVILKPKNTGKFTLEALYYDRDKMMVNKEDEPQKIELAALNIENIEKNIPTKLRELPNIGNPTTQKEITLSEDHSYMHGIAKKTKEEIKMSLASMFLMNGKTYDIKRNDLKSKLGEIEIWKVTNKSHMDHPFHIHGTQFELVSSTYKNKTIKPEYRSLQDTINIRPNETVELKMKQTHKGIRMYHCHILEHEDLGMMGNLLVE